MNLVFVNNYNANRILLYCIILNLQEFISNWKLVGLPEQPMNPKVYHDNEKSNENKVHVHSQIKKSSMVVQGIICVMIK